MEIGVVAIAEKCLGMAFQQDRVQIFEHFDLVISADGAHNGFDVWI